MLYGKRLQGRKSAWSTLKRRSPHGTIHEHCKTLRSIASSDITVIPSSQQTTDRSSTACGSYAIACICLLTKTERLYKVTQKRQRQQHEARCFVYIGAHCSRAATSVASSRCQARGDANRAHSVTPLELGPVGGAPNSAFCCMRLRCQRLRHVTNVWSDPLLEWPE